MNSCAFHNTIFSDLDLEKNFVEIFFKKVAKRNFISSDVDKLNVLEKISDNYKAVSILALSCNPELMVKVFSNTNVNIKSNPLVILNVLAFRLKKYVTVSFGVSYDPEQFVKKVLDSKNIGDDKETLFTLICLLDYVIKYSAQKRIKVIDPFVIISAAEYISHVLAPKVKEHLKEKSIYGKCRCNPSYNYNNPNDERLKDTFSKDTDYVSVKDLQYKNHQRVTMTTTATFKVDKSENDTHPVKNYNEFLNEVLESKLAFTSTPNSNTGNGSKEISLEEFSKVLEALDILEKHGYTLTK